MNQSKAISFAARRALLDARQYREMATEHQLQVTLLKWFYSQRRRSIMFAIPNAGKRSMHTARRMKDEGLLAGVADLQVMLPDGRSAWLELKKSNGRQSMAQKIFQDICERLDHPYCLAKSFEQAEAFLKETGAL